jgi:hypothetical protein
MKYYRRTTKFMLEVQKPSQALISVKDPVNTFDLSPKWARTLSSFDIFLWVLYKAPQIQISKLIFDTLLWA